MNVSTKHTGWFMATQPVCEQQLCLCWLLPAPEGRGAFLPTSRVFAEASVAAVTLPHTSAHSFVLQITQGFQDKGMFLQRKMVKESRVAPFLNTSPFSSCSRGELLSIKYISHHVHIQGFGMTEPQAMLHSVRSEMPAFYMHSVLLLLNVQCTNYLTCALGQVCCSPALSRVAMRCCYGLTGLLFWTAPACGTVKSGDLRAAGEYCLRPQPFCTIREAAAKHIDLLQQIHGNLEIFNLHPPKLYSLIFLSF